MEVSFTRCTKTNWFLLVYTVLNNHFLWMLCICYLYFVKYAHFLWRHNCDFDVKFLTTTKKKKNWELKCLRLYRHLNNTVFTSVAHSFARFLRKHIVLTCMMLRVSTRINFNIKLGINPDSRHPIYPLIHCGWTLMWLIFCYFGSLNKRENAI